MRLKNLPIKNKLVGINLIVVMLADGNPGHTFPADEGLAGDAT